MNESSCKALADINDSVLQRICCYTSLPNEYRDWLFLGFVIVANILMVYALFYIATHPVSNENAVKRK